MGSLLSVAEDELLIYLTKLYTHNSSTASFLGGGNCEDLSVTPNNILL